MARTLTTLRPRLTTATTNRAPLLDIKPGTTEMPRGRAWMETRHRVALAHGYQCQGCSRVWVSNLDQIDHRIPREQGGSNHDSNLQPLCKDCHDAKTVAELRYRVGGGRSEV